MDMSLLKGIPRGKDLFNSELPLFVLCGYIRNIFIYQGTGAPLLWRMPYVTAQCNTSQAGAEREPCSGKANRCVSTKDFISPMNLFVQTKLHSFPFYVISAVSIKSVL